jgi:pSer/pThr/pTyr-binding forkhead associated (FHA) protein
MAPREASRIHATGLRQVGPDGVTYRIRDENSRNGTFVNGRKVSAAEGGGGAGGAGER